MTPLPHCSSPLPSANTLAGHILLKIIFLGVYLLYSATSFYCLTKWISWTYTYIPLFFISPIQIPTERYAEFLALCSSFSLVICFINSVNSLCMSIPICQLIPLPFPFGVHRLVIYICVSISALQIGSSVPFFQIPHISINI